MNLFLTKAERIKYLGFDDRIAALIGIPLVSFMAFLLFSSGKTDIPVHLSFVCFWVGTGYTVFYWLINRFWVIRLRSWLPGEKDTTKRILLIAGFAFFSVILLELGTSDLILKCIPMLAQVGWGEQEFVFKISTTYTLCLMVLAMYESAWFFTKLRKSQLQQEQLAKENMQTQLAVLKQQMNPHFLFNSLNTLVNVIPEDSKKATLFTQRLAAVYRRILEYRHKEMIPLVEELTALQDYIFLMQTRFEDKLIVKWHLSEETMKQVMLQQAQWGALAQVQCKEEESRDLPIIPPHLTHHLIVPLSVQLLVENAVKHNTVSNEHPLQIDITLGEDRVTVSNKLNLRNRKMSSTGWGHDNLKSRYSSISFRPVVIRKTKDSYSVSLPILPPAEVRELAEERRTG
ncbi:sensor histidine kinase [Neolewinella agarilytica]|uniref:sensor histidine kinase n=1 Tax=Neolewinella agarilytica TaxID=478744 RepID=UPI002355A026|nr:sensor histidine kinase [Neolewinella agarilytica]